MRPQSSEESEEWISDEEWAAGEVSGQTRRRLLRNILFGASGAGVSFLAGCSTSTEESPDGGGTSKYVDDTLNIICGTPPKDATFNPYSVSAKYDFKWWWGQFDELAVHDTLAGKTKGMVLKDWSYGKNGETTWKINENYTWTNGKDLTAEDVVTQLKLGQLWNAVNKSYGVAPLYKNVQQTGKYELQFELTKPDINRAIFHQGHIERRSWFWAYRGIWGKWAEKYDDATTKSEINSIRQEMANDLKAPITDNSQVPGCGPWNHYEVSGQTLKFKPHEEYVSPYNPDHTGADLDYDLESTLYTNQQQRTAAMKQEQLDASYPPDSKDARQQLRDLGFEPAKGLSVEEILPNMRGLSMGYLFNMQDPITGTRNVRRAIAHVIPRRPLISWSTDFKNLYIADEIPSGLGQNKEVPWFGGRDNWPNSFLRDSLEAYAYTEDDVDTQKATQLLKKEGFSKSGNRWHDADGKPITLSIYTQTASTEPIQLKNANIMKTYLDDFGLTTEVTAQKESIMSSNTQPSGNWHLITHYLGTIGPPYFDFNVAFLFIKNDEGEVVPDREKWALTDTVEVPYPIGNPDGALKKVNLHEMVESLTKKMPESKRQQKVEELCWIYNQLMPMFPTNEEGGGSSYWLNKSHWMTKGPQDGDNPVFRYYAVGAGEYDYPHYAAKFGNKWFGPIPKNK